MKMAVTHMRPSVAQMPSGGYGHKRLEVKTPEIDL